MKKNTKTIIGFILGVAIGIYCYKVVFPDLVSGFREGWNSAKKERSK
ncbi:hypothetical protein V7S76_10450 [Aquirufa sp. ROCK2-A2]